MEILGQTLQAQFGGTDGTINIDPKVLLETIAKAMSTETAKPKARRTKAPRDPNKPKQPKSSYFIWSDTERNSARSYLQESADPDQKITIGEVAKELSKRWKALTAEEKSPFEAQSKEARIEYAEKIATYREENGIVATSVRRSTKFDASTKPDAPEGWTGPHDGYLEKAPKDPDTGKSFTKSFHTFDEAVAAAVRIGAGGITRAPTGFKLRAAKVVSINALSRSRDEVSWILESGAVSPDESPVTPIQMKASVMKSDPKPRDPTPEPPTQDEDDEEAVDVEEFMHNGKTYLKDADGDLFEDNDNEEDEQASIGHVDENGTVELY